MTSETQISVGTLIRATTDFYKISSVFTTCHAQEAPEAIPRGTYGIAQEILPFRVRVYWLLPEGGMSSLVHTELVERAAEQP